MKTTSIKTTTLPLPRQVEITHTQTVRQSKDYQSAEVSYGVKLCAEDTPLAIKKGIERAESLVEDALTEKMREHQQLLQALTANR